MKKHFITGLIILLPLAVTIAILAFIVNFLTTPFMGIVQNILGRYSPNEGYWFLSEEQFLRYASKMIILAILFGFTLLLGLLTRSFFIHKLIQVADYILHQIPVINKLYKPSKDIIETIFRGNSNAFRQVVLVPYPSPDIYSVGLVPSTIPKECAKLVGEEVISVFVPTTPNPTSGFLIMVKKKNVIYLDTPVEDAVKYVISCGVMHPASMKSIPEELAAISENESMPGEG
jgi:uncharacterized membrane protein